MDNAKRVSNFARVNEGSFTAQSAWSSDGRWLALPSAYGVYLFDAPTLTQVRFIDETEHVENIAFSPDSNWLAIHTRRMVPWHPETSDTAHGLCGARLAHERWCFVREFKGESWIGPAVFSPDNKFLPREALAIRRGYGR